jgi:hypothetical protein
MNLSPVSLGSLDIPSLRQAERVNAHGKEIIAPLGIREVPKVEERLALTRWWRRFAVGFGFGWLLEAAAFQERLDPGIAAGEVMK